MSWIPAVVFLVAAFVPVGWLLSVDGDAASQPRAFGVVAVMILGGVVGTVLLLGSIGSASLVQVGAGLLTMVSYVGALGFFAIQVGVRNVVRLVFKPVLG